MKIARLALSILFFSAGGAAPALAETFPARPIELTILWAAGTAPDVVGRALGEGMARHLGQPVLAVNKPGAGGAVAYRYTAGQKPDGYSLIMNSNSISTAYHSGTLPFDYHAFDPIAQVSVESPIVVVRADSPYNNLAQLLAYAKQHPGDLKVGNSGIGSHLQIASESFFEQQHVDVAHIPFASSISITNLLGGYIDASMTLPGSVAPHVAAGSLKVLGVLASRRDPTFPDVPTAIEQGYDFSADMWRGVAAPKGLPDDVRAKLEQAIRATVESDDFKRRGLQGGFQPVFLGHQAFGQTIAKEDAVIATALDKLGLKKSQ